MNTDFYCNLCNGTTGKKIPFRYAFKDRFLWAVKCKGCGLVSIYPRPSDAEIDEMYGDAYYTEADSKTHHMDVDYLQILNAGDYKEGVLQMQQYCKQGAILDIGCATGNFLFALKNNGFTVKGIELSTFAAEYGNKNFGVNIINKPFSHDLLGKEISENEFDIVLMGDVLEHFTDPTSAMKLVHTILKPGGVALVQVPGTLNLLSSRVAFMLYRLTGSQKTMYIPPYHLTEFTEQTARKMFEVAGFKKINVEQHIKHPSTITLRGSKLENLGKKYFQYINLYITRWFGAMGDRIHIEAYK